MGGRSGLGPCLVFGGEHCWLDCCCSLAEPLARPASVELTVGGHEVGEGAHAAEQEATPGGVMWGKARGRRRR